MKKIVIIIGFFVVLFAESVSATEYIYVLNNSDVYTYVIGEPGINPPVIIDCQDEDNPDSDPIGCIIASNDLEKQIAIRRSKVNK